MRDATVDVSQPITASGNPASDTATPTAAILNTIRYGGCGSLVRTVLWAHVPTTAMHAVAAGPSANNAQK